MNDDDFRAFLARYADGPLPELQPWQLDFLEQFAKGDLRVIAMPRHDPTRRLIIEYWLHTAEYVEIVDEDVRGRFHDGTTFLALGAGRALAEQVLAEADRTARRAIPEP